MARCLLEAVRRLRMPDGSEPSACVGMYLTAPDVLALRAAGVRALPVALKTDATIDIPAGGWDAWQAALRAEHRWTADRIRKEVRRFERVGYRVEHRTLREAYRDSGAGEDRNEVVGDGLGSPTTTAPVHLGR